MWKYINPGDYRFLHNHNGTSYTNLSDETKFTKTGMGYTTQSLEDYPIKLPNNASEIWFKADIYVNDEATIVFNSKNSGYETSVSLSQDEWRLNVAHYIYDTENETWGSVNEIRAESMDLEGKTVSVLLHIKGEPMDESSTSNVAHGEVELRLNNRIVAKIENLAVMNGEPLQIQSITSDIGESYYSNIIVSTEQIVLRENVYTLPIANTVAEGWVHNTENGADTYTTDSAGKSIVQTVDAEALRTALGEDISITSVVMQAFDLSSNDEETVDSIQKIIKSNDTEYLVGSTLMATNSYISESIINNPATGNPWTFEDLANTELILRTAKSSA